jgi:hypothetical protein
MSAQKGRPSDPSATLGLIEAEPEGGPGADRACGIGQQLYPKEVVSSHRLSPRPFWGRGARGEGFFDLR